jgi:hypothetical protein
MKLEKTIVDGDLWYIDNFLTEEEIDLFKPYMYDKNEWYVTMRSPYKNVLNKFIGAEVMLDDEKNVTTIPGPQDKIPEWFYPIFDRIREVLPIGHYPQAATLQTFKGMTQQQAKSLLIPKYQEKYADKDIDFAFDWHYERVPGFNDTILRSFSCYLNDDFEGGELEFRHKDYKISPKPGRFVSIPVSGEFEHKVAFVDGKDRHTWYGAIFESEELSMYSEPGNC